MENIILITGASSGFGALAARALAIAGHTVYASMRETTGRTSLSIWMCNAKAICWAIRGQPQLGFRCFISTTA